jgi:hypothetical protein
MHQQPFSFLCFMALLVTVYQWQLAHSILAFQVQVASAPPGCTDRYWGCILLSEDTDGPHPLYGCGSVKGIIIDLFHPFGLHSTGGNLGKALDATLDALIQWLSIAFIAKWVDDIIPVHVPVSGSAESGWAYGVSLAQILDEMQWFGWLINPLKLINFSSTVKYIGVSGIWKWRLSHCLKESTPSTWLKLISSCQIPAEAVQAVVCPYMMCKSWMACSCTWLLSIMMANHISPLSRPSWWDSVNLVIPKLI